MTDRADALAAIDGIVERGGEADDVLRAVLAALHDHGIAYAAIRFVEDGRLADGPAIGAPTAAHTTPVVYNGEQVGELELADDDVTFAERVATSISDYVLVGWDTSGEAWSP